MHKIFLNVKFFIFNNPLLTLFFIATTLFFLFQHIISITWDFSSYVLNAKCFFYGGQYCETQRPPLASFILAPFLVFGKLGEFLYIIAISILFFYSSLKIADVSLSKHNSEEGKRVARWIFAFFSISTFTLLFGQKEGTELLTLSLLELAIAQIIISKNSGWFLGLAFLARYSSIVFLPLMFFYRKPRDIIKNIASFATITFPWFLWNFIFHGNWFTGFVDGYAQNISLRLNIMPLEIKDIFAISGYYTIPAILGILLSIFFLFSSKKEYREYRFTFVIISLFTALLIWNYSIIPAKFPRYLFNLIIPIAFFSSIFLIFAISYLKKLTRIIAIIVGILFILTIFSAADTTLYGTKYALPFEEAADEIKQLNLSKCEILSPHWVQVAYYTENAYPLSSNSVIDAVEKNKTVLIFTKEKTPEDSFTEQDLQQLPILKKTENYVFYAKPGIQRFCSPKYFYNKPYVKDHCSPIAQSSPFLREQIKFLCYSINRNP